MKQVLIESWSRWLILISQVPDVMSYELFHSLYLLVLYLVDLQVLQSLGESLDILYQNVVSCDHYFAFVGLLLAWWSSFLHFGDATRSSCCLSLTMCVLRVFRAWFLCCHRWSSVVVQLCRHRVEILDYRSFAIWGSLTTASRHAGFIIGPWFVIVGQSRFTLGLALWKFGRLSSNASLICRGNLFLLILK